MAIRVSITAFTHPGLGRGARLNQDRVAVGDWSASGTLWRPWRSSFEVVRPLLCCVADGMGGHAGGDIASRLAIEALQRSADRLASASDVDRAIVDADLAIRQHALQEPALAEMGTTAVGLIVCPDRLLRFNIGDSRLYQHRDGFLRQISIDDVSSGARSHGARESHRITQWLGGATRAETLDPHIGCDEPILTGSRWLLCSDGVTDMLSLAQMEAALNGNDLEAWVTLFGAVMENGADDNLSMILVSIEGARGEKRHG